ncbi:MAG: hypothetical protein ACREHD_10305 [Pirellulales bacterium]
MHRTARFQAYGTFVPGQLRWRPTQIAALGVTQFDVARLASDARNNSPLGETYVALAARPIWY